VQLVRLVVVASALVVLSGTTARATSEAPSPDCFGAAARDARHPCANPKLRLAVVPKPARAAKGRNSPCSGLFTERGISVCRFGAPLETATATGALIGDSHASHWRAALEIVFEEKGWHGLSATQQSCPFQFSLRDLTERRVRRACIRWKQRLPGWFRRHKEIDTVFVAGLTGGSGVVATHGRSEFGTQVSGYLAAWRALPRSVKHIIVLRDTPKAGPDMGLCVLRALARKQPPGATCARPRSAALYPDPAVVAAQRTKSERVEVIDMSRYFCDSRRCFPVIGGALVWKDPTHITLTFGTTLGPYLLRAVNRLARSWR
jgi:hypothetical protein